MICFLNSLLSNRIVSFFKLKNNLYVMNHKVSRSRKNAFVVEIFVRRIRIMKDTSFSTLIFIRWERVCFIYYAMHTMYWNLCNVSTECIKKFLRETIFVRNSRIGFRLKSQDFSNCRVCYGGKYKFSNLQWFISFLNFLFCSKNSLENLLI